MIIPVVAAVLRDAHGRLLLAQRPEGKHLAGLWEFPGGKLEPDETPPQALKREIAEELGIEIHDAVPLLTLTHHYADRSVRLMLLEVEAWGGSPAGLEGQALRWVSLDQARELAMPSADRPIIKVMGLGGSLAVIPEPTAFVSKDHFLAALESALRAGATFLRIKMPFLLEDQASKLADQCADVIKDFKAKWILESSPDVAVSAGADGVVLSAEAANSFESRPLADDLLVAVDCRTGDDLAAAGRLDADFVVLGPTDSDIANTTAPDWARWSALIADSPVPVFLAAGSMPVDLGQIRKLGAYGFCAPASVQ